MEKDIAVTHTNKEMPYFVQYCVVGNVGCHFVLNLLIFLLMCFSGKKILVS